MSKWVKPNPYFVQCISWKSCVDIINMVYIILHCSQMQVNRVGSVITQIVSFLKHIVKYSISGWYSSFSFHKTKIHWTYDTYISVTYEAEALPWKWYLCFDISAKCRLHKEHDHLHDNYIFQLLENVLFVKIAHFISRTILVSTCLMHLPLWFQIWA